MSSNNIPSIERITFFSGQPLEATDLTTLESANRELRELHNRSLHQWGIGIGFEVAGNRGDSFVTISPGYGIDCLGREIILTAPQTKTVPSIAVGSSGTDAIYYLVAIYKPDADQEVAQTRQGICAPPGTIRLTEEPLLDWHTLTQLVQNLGKELILARVSIRNCVLSQPLSFAERRYARPAQQPYIAGGQTDPQSTPWVDWSVGTTKLGVALVVDTTKSGFQTVPLYLTQILGEQSQKGIVFTPGFMTITDATPNHFTLQVKASSGNATDDPAMLANTLEWRVAWIGIEG